MGTRLHSAKLRDIKWSYCTFGGGTGGHRGPGSWGAGSGLASGPGQMSVAVFSLGEAAHKICWVLMALLLWRCWITFTASLGDLKQMCDVPLFAELIPASKVTSLKWKPKWPGCDLFGLGVCKPFRECSEWEWCVIVVLNQILDVDSLMRSL